MVLAIALTLPFVQTKIGQYVTNLLNTEFKTNINVEQVSITVFGGVKLKKVLILDHHKDTLIFANRIKTNIRDWNRLYNGDLIFGDLRLDGLLFNLKTYKNEKESNIDKFVAAFETGKPPSKGHFLLTSNRVFLTNGHFILTDENRIIPKDIDFTKISFSISEFKIYGPNVNTNINKLSFLDHRGVFIKNLNSVFSYTKKQILLKNFYIETNESQLKGDLAMNYKIEDFINFNDKVQFDLKLYPSKLASNDIRYFYNELGKNEYFFINSTIKGAINNLTLSNLNLVDTNKSLIQGNVNFKNLFGNEHQYFYMDAKFDKVSSSYANLVKILPNVLGKKLPQNLKKLGTFTLVGNTQITRSSIDASFKMNSNLGIVQSDLSMRTIDFIDKASYVGKVVLNNFDIGTFLDQKDLGLVSLDIDVDGKGFTKKYLNTSLKGIVSQIEYNSYNYTNIDVNGTFKLPIYQGQISVNDPNLNMKFDGLIDLTTKDNKYDFHINVENSDLNKLKINNDSISLFKGDIVVQVAGNTIENLQGDVFIKKTAFQNVKGTYNFDDFSINSTFGQDGLRTIKLNSVDILEGEVVGKYEFGQLRNLIANSLGSLYANYKPNIVKKGQFLKFNFAVYSKIFEIFYPDISIGTNTIIKGSINSDNQDFKLNFNSPQIKVSDITFDNIRVKVDNKNPLYNAYVELDSIKNKHYKIRDFSLINVTLNDTLFVRSEFKGGSVGEDYFNLNVYHTINKENKNVVGLSKSEIKLKDYLWFLNENDTPDNQIVFDKDLRNFNFDNIILSHENQEISFKGDIIGDKHKDFKLSFRDVDLNQITPSDPKFIFNGNVNGEFNYKQDDFTLQPRASINIKRLNINNTPLGTLNFDIAGDENLKKFTLNSTIQNDNLASFDVNGNFEIANNETLLDLKLKFYSFNLGVLSSLGGDVLSNIRGTASGNANIGGSIKKPEINGRLFVDDAGITIPYLNVDYALADKTIVDLSDQKFLLRNVVLTDTKFGTKGSLNGNIEHNNFSDWKLDLAINSKRLLVLNTKDFEEAAYYGVAYINGKASIKGLTNSLFIKVDAKSDKGSALKIPINDSDNAGENDFIHFLSAKEKYNIKKGIVDNSRNYKGLELEFDLDITPDAEVEVILDRNSGHGMKGKGNGTLLFKINTLGKFNMWGDFQAYEGTYNFKYGGIIDKKFTVKKGGSISWEGDPMKARLNLEAIYKTTANPALLLDNSSLNKKVDVNVIIGVKGDLKSPEPDFNFEFPNVSSVLKSEIQYKLNDKDARQTQALYLLSTGSFSTAVGLNQSALSGNIFETAKGLLSSIVQSEDEKFKVDIDIITADRTIGKEADGRFVASISSKINERFTFNGRVGIPYGGINQTAVIGNVEFLYRVNEDGTLNLRFFNKENDINYIGQGIGYTQGAGVSYEVDFDVFSELINKIFKINTFKKSYKINEVNQDSNLPPEIDKSSQPNKPSSNNQIMNQESIIPDED